MQLGGVVVQPSAPRAVVWPPRRDERPESRPVPEDPEVGQLVDDHGLQGLVRGQDQAP